ncbi:MAG: dual specificity protein phosphatase family protein [Uliginosibacterium sp.]|nr:dual specificity protein phosphatase family protein [Uliginosibacterium sp.]
MTNSAVSVKRPWPWALLWGALLGTLFFTSYGAANHFTAQRGDVGSYVFGWEHAIPLLPWTILPYWSIDLFYGIALFAARSKVELFRLVRRLLAAQLICITGFLLWPLRFSFTRPATEGWTGALFDALTGFDLPYNQAPSLHICLLVVLWRFYADLLQVPTPRHSREGGNPASSFPPAAEPLGSRLRGNDGLNLPTLHATREQPRTTRHLWLQGLLHVWFTLIALSVLTTWQHHFIDVLLGFWAGALCLLLVPENEATWRWRGHEPGRLRLALAYLGGALLAAGLGYARFPAASAWLLYWAAAALAGVATIYLFGEAAHFGKQAGRLPWRSWMVFGPYLIGARLNVWWWTRTLPAGAEVLEGVFLGRQPDAATLAQHQIDCVVDLCAELPLPARPSAARSLPLLDLLPPSRAQLASAAHAIEEARQQRLRVWVCCALGFSRSAASVASWLVQHRGHSPEQALARIRQARPQVVLNPALLQTESSSA